MVMVLVFSGVWELIRCDRVLLKVLISVFKLVWLDELDRRLELVRFWWNLLKLIDWVFW